MKKGDSAISAEKGSTLLSSSEEETRSIGARIGRGVKSGDVIALTGELGSGKTCLVQGIARGLGVDPSAPVNSPSFVLINEYPGPVPLYHIDLYRLRDGRELFDLGWEDYLDRRGVIAIEWAERAGPFLPPDCIGIALEITGETTRKVRLSGRKLADLMAAITTDKQG